MVDLLCAFDLWWIVRKVLVDRKSEVEASARVHALIRLDGEVKVQDIVWIWKLRTPCLARLQLVKVLLYS